MYKSDKENGVNIRTRTRTRQSSSLSTSSIKATTFKLNVNMCNNIELGSTTFRQTTLKNLQVSMKDRVTPSVLTRAVESFMICIRDKDFHVIGGGLACLNRLLQVQLHSMSHHSSASLLNQLLPEHRRREIVTRLGHSKPSVRNKVLDLLVYAATVSREFQAPLFIAHCNSNSWLVRLNMVQFLTETLARQIYLADSTVVELCTPILTVLMDDRRPEVREAAVDALVVLNQCDVDGVLLATLRSQPGLKRSAIQHLFNRFNEAAGGTNDGENSTKENNNASTEVEKEQPKREQSTKQTPKPKREKVKPSFGPVSPTGDEPFALPIECDIVECSKDVETFLQNMDKLETVISSLTADWNARIQSMVQLQGLLLGGCFVVHAYHGNENVWKSIVDGLVIQLGDLRSKVVRQACATVSTLSASLGSFFHPHVEKIVPPLIALTGIAKKVMSSSADLCIKYIIGSHMNGYPKMLKLLVDATNKKGNRDSTRSSCQQYIRLALSAWPKKSCHKESESICNSIMHSLKDANVEVRAAARLSYWAFQVHFNKSSKKILQSLSTSETNRLYDAKPLSELGNGNDSIILQQRLKFVGLEENSTFASSFSDGKNSIKVTKVPEKAAPGHFHSRREVFPVRNSNSEEHVSLTSATSPSGNATVRALKAPTSTITPHLTAVTDLSRPSQRPSSVRRENEKSEMAGAASSTIEDNQISENQQMKKTEEPSYYTKYVQNAQQQKQAQEEKKTEEPEKTDREKDYQQDQRQQGTAKLTELQHQDIRKIRHQQTITVAEVHEHLRTANAADWKSRLRCFDQLSLWLNENRNKTISLNGGNTSTLTTAIEKMINRIISSIPDAHHKVTRSALIGLSNILRLTPTDVQHINIFTSALPKMLSHVFQTLVDARGGLRKESNIIISLVLDRFETNDVVSILVTLLDHSSAKTRLGCMEVLLHLIPMAGRILSHTSVMRQAVHKTCENCNSSNVSLRRASENVLISLHALNIDLMLTQLNTVHTHLRESIINQLKTKIPHLKQSLANNGRVSINKSRENKPQPPAPHSAAPMMSTPSCTPRSKPNNVRYSRSKKKSSANTNTAIKDCTSAAFIRAQHDVVDILTSLSSSSSHASKARGLVQVSQLSRTLQNQKKEWSIVFPQLIIAVVSTLKSDEPSTRVHGLMSIRTMLEMHPLPFNGLTDIVLRSTLDACRDDVQDVLSSASTTLQLMASTLNCTCCAKSLLSIMSSLNENEDTSVMKMCLRTMGMFIPRMSSATVYGALDDIMPPVLRCINSSESSIRKESVFLFVKIYTSVGDVHARPYMNTLTVAQQKLCTIYIKRKNVLK